MNRLKWHLPISVKLVSVSVMLILAVAIPIAIRNSQAFEERFGESQDIFNSQLADSKASEFEGLTINYLEKIRTVTELFLQDFADEEQRRRALELVFFRDLDLVNVEVYHLVNGRPQLFRSETNEKYLKDNGLDKAYMDRLRRERPFPLAQLFAESDRVQIRGATLKGGAPLFRIGVPFPDPSGVVRHVALGHVRLDRLQKVFALSGGARTVYLIDTLGNVLVHSDDKVTLSGARMTGLKIVQEALTSSKAKTKVQMKFKDPETETSYIGRFAKTAFGPTVIAQVPEAIILEPAAQMRIEVSTVAGYVLFGALFFVIVFSLTLTRPIEKLHEAHLFVARGNFKVRAKIRSHDEVGQLAISFNEMVGGLEERDKIKNIFNKFHGSTVTEDLLKKGDVNLGGTKKNVTVLFSDIRDFTKFSEGHTPEEVVEMLNEYFQIMVSIITKNHGIVDKFVGDAIMAVWGAPQSTGDDAADALKASLEMRVALNELNRVRGARGHTPIKIGIGLHSGPAISGTIGSLERMEYTVIGDTVNMASRIESSTKAFGADLLVSSTVCQGNESRFIFEYAGAAEVKGKSEPIKMFKVRGTINAQGEHHLIQTPYSDYEAGHAEKVHIAG